jgi:hypothetical protein
MADSKDICYGVKFCLEAILVKIVKLELRISQVFNVI